MLILPFSYPQELAALLEGLLASIERAVATGWLCAAIEEDERYRSTKKVAP